MENEMFTFVVCTHLGHHVEQFYGTRRDADKHFDEEARKMHAASATGLFVAYYAASVGGLVNASFVAS